MAESDFARDLHRIIGVCRALGSERDLDRLLELILREATALVTADRASLFLVDEGRKELWTRIAQGAGEIRLPLGSGIAGSVAATAQVINIPEAHADPRFNPENDRRSGYHTRSILCMPLLNHLDVVVGVIQVLNKLDGTAFDGHDEHLLSALCGQAAVAIDNAQLITKERESQRLAREMELARQIQLSLLPDAPPEVSGWRFAAYTRSCDETGGDYYDFITRPDGGVDVVIGDVSGHGIAAAMLMSTARAFLRALHPVEPDAGRLITRMNELLELDMADDTFMSFAHCRLGSDGSCALVNAGHEAPLFYRQGQGFDNVDIGGLLLGMLPDMLWESTAVPSLVSGDLMVLFTDGVFEAQAPPDFQTFGLDRLKETVVANAAGGAKAVCDAVVSAVDAWLAGHHPHDDLTLVVVERL